MRTHGELSVSTRSFVLSFLFRTRGDANSSISDDSVDVGCFKFGEFCHFVLKGSKVSESNLNLLKMPPSQPLPPKENALFKRILVSLIKLGFDVPLCFHEKKNLFQSSSAF